ncbi:hypothetical protein [uncultured Gammaproteobacteria bacterium]|nr:hypothetical protein [uncultured Gammaproteobacteria bacterium]CAC9563982.1 hypothetical protein [uncultured Gammaproteobacteria bacterium]CAC9584247.1 hypothetical protein [uncultured Gammaproteobacteria bacterium]CAC9587966.1 hypothetical protein [uncultured Gammaproteobacteria bacterium]CAC9965648.1 hypothetical protein [uncultured Gammaproteobacteria bacterium]
MLLVTCYLLLVSELMIFLLTDRCFKKFTILPFFTETPSA